MSRKTNMLDFEGQVFNIGIDTHKSNWKVTVRQNSMELKKFSMNPEPLELLSYMSKHYPGGRYRSVYEAGFSGYWIHRSLSELGIDNIIINPSDVPTTHKEKDRKSDGVDSAKLSRELENGSLTGIYIPTMEQESIRALARLARQYSKRSTQVKTRITSFLDVNGVRLAEGLQYSYWSKNHIKWISELEFKLPVNRYILDKHLQELQHIRGMRLELLRKVRECSRNILTVRLLRSIPGIGLTVAFILYTELMDIRRFESEDPLASYIGLVPSTASTNDKEHNKGMTQRHSRYLRYILIEAAWIAVRRDPAMTLAFSKLTKRMSKTRAIIRIAKKLLKRIRWVWLHQKEYVTAIVE